MIYRLSWVLMNLILRVYFRKAYISNAERIPVGKPVILACNHPNSFTDAMLLACLLKRPIHFFARSDAFNTPFKHWFFNIWHLHPIFRIEEGKENLVKNNDTFDIGHSLMRNKKTLLIHSEGVCVVEKRLRKIKKGTARMAFWGESKDEFKLDSWIVPVGFNYTFPTKFREEVMVQIGEPYPVAEFEEVFLESSAKAILEFNNKLTKELTKVVISINEKKNESMTEGLFALFRNTRSEKLFPWKRKNLDRFEMEYGISNKINILQENAENDLEILRTKVNNYFNQLKKYKISDDKLLTSGSVFKKIPLLLILAPFLLPGIIGNFLPFFLPPFITKKVVKGDVFHTSMMLGSGFFITIIYGLLVLILFAVFAPLWALPLALAIPLCGYLSLLFYELLLDLKQSSDITKFKNKNPEIVDLLKKERQEILDYFKIIS